MKILFISNFIFLQRVQAMNVKPKKNSIFLKKGKMVISVETGNSLDFG